MVFCNFDGTDKHQLFYIGTARKPLAFKKKPASEYRIVYGFKKRDWMTAEIFFDWLRQFNKRMRSAGRKVLLFVDNCRAHGREENLMHMKNIEVVYLPLNSTSKIQPCNAGIIASLKVQFRRYKTKRAIDLRDDSKECIYKLDVLSAVLALQRVWEDLPLLVIKICREHAGLCNGNNAPTEHITEDPYSGDSSDQKTLQPCINCVVPTPAHIEISQFLNSEGESECVEVITEGAMVNHVIERNESPGVTDNDDEVISLLSFQQQLATVALGKRMCEI